MVPSSQRLGVRGLDQSSPRSESDDDLSSAMSRMAFSMGARLPLGVMPMGWITCSLQPGWRGRKVTNLQQTTQEEMCTTAEMQGLWKLPVDSPEQPQATTKNLFLEVGDSSTQKTSSMLRQWLEAQSTSVAILRFPGIGSVLGSCSVWYRIARGKLALASAFLSLQHTMEIYGLNALPFSLPPLGAV